ncbi:MAG: hypothetical protein JRN26_00990 [Nitrososphaerota archaeon]|jgi:hypothetical protein|nr:hypothetical protein [Nitrososphaerota archaeon]MDG6928249.1 hypothetical protein [Nitrososphaerota archaeon]MDG6930743.1 hypothetical protein [Nitrososphaerota archaeon]MDG6931821.1 hypothetical protein [Nitrososphaerota archaeon]MDG6935455.1 hypothetical protein [Nitrososphaerota archaeon]
MSDYRASEATDFLEYIREDMNLLKKEMEESQKAVKDALDYLTGKTDPKKDIFEEPDVFVSKINEAHEVLHRYVKLQMRIDTQLKSAMAEQQPQQQQSQGGWREKLSSVFGTKKPAEQYEHMSPSTNTIDMESEILRLRRQYESYLNLLKFQNTEARKALILLHWRNAASHIFVNILNYVRASYENEIDMYMQVRESLTRSMLAQGAHAETGDKK